MKKKFIKLAIFSFLSLVIGCANQNITTSSSLSTSFSSNIESSSEDFSRPIRNTSSNTSKSDEKTSSSKNEESSDIKSTSSINFTSEKEYEKLTPPDNKNNPIDISSWNNYSFIEELPEYFSYIYGNNKATPDIYSDGGGLVMDKNEGPRKRVQTPYFNAWNKVELRIDLGKFHGTQKTQNKNDPVFTIDCFDTSGSLIDIYYIDEINVSDNSQVKVYIKNINVSYLEIRATNLPTKSNKVYNFGIKGISLKGWIYD